MAAQTVSRAEFKFRYEQATDGDWIGQFIEIQIDSHVRLVHLPSLPPVPHRQGFRRGMLKVTIGKEEHCSWGGHWDEGQVDWMINSLKALFEFSYSAASGYKESFSGWLAAPLDLYSVEFVDFSIGIIREILERGGVPKPELITPLGLTRSETWAVRGDGVPMSFLRQECSRQLGQLYKVDSGEPTENLKRYYLPIDSLSVRLGLRLTDMLRSMDNMTVSEVITRFPQEFKKVGMSREEFRELQDGFMATGLILPTMFHWGWVNW